MDSKKKNEKNLECALSFVEGSEPFDDVVLTADVRQTPVISTLELYTFEQLVSSVLSLSISAMYSFSIVCSGMFG